MQNFARKEPSQLTMRSAIMDIQAIHTHLPNAIYNGELDVHYQPQYNIESKNSTHMEALVRWHHPQYGAVSPATFIPVAEELGLVEEITYFVIERVISDFSEWQKSDVPLASVAINISARLISCESNAKRLIALLGSVKSFAPHIVLELTETAMVQNVHLAHYCMHQFRELGYKIALDDFGTGYSSLAYLLEFPIDIIKIDRCFVSKLQTCSKGTVIISSIISLASQLGMKVVAEGVEEAVEIELLTALGCHLIQGYYFSKPLPMARVLDFMICNQICA